MRLVLLPGMDGTGDLFGPVAAELDVQTQTIRYPPQRPLGYTELEALALSELPVAAPYVLLGESFSGPIALSIAATRPPSLRGVILCCSFASNPRPALGAFRRLLRWTPARPPLGALMWLLAGSHATPALREALSGALAAVSPAALRARLAAVVEVDVVARLQAISVPLLYLQALEDRVVPPAAGRAILENVHRSRVAQLAAPHFLLQTRPSEAARMIDDFVREVARAG